MSKEEHDELNKRVALAGISKQEYMICKSLDKEIIVTGNLRTYKALRNQFIEFHDLLKYYNATHANIDTEVLELMNYVTYILDGLHNHHA